MVFLEEPWAALAQGGRVVSQDAAVSFGSSIGFRAVAEGAHVDRASLVFHVAGDDYSNLAIGKVQDGGAVQLSYTLDTRRFFLPPGSEVGYRWELKFRDGTEALGPEGRLQYVDDRFHWQQVTKGPVSVFWYGEGPGYAEMVANLAADKYQELAGRYGVPTPPIKIYNYRGTADLGGALPRGSAEWIGGQTFPSAGIILVALGESPSDARRVIPHELSHVVTWLASRNPYNDLPRWLDEGLAVAEELVDKEAYTSAVQKAARDGTLPSVRSLNSNFAYNPQLAHLSYAASYSFVTFLQAKYGTERTVQLVRSFRDGLDYGDAVEAVFGTDLDSLNRQWVQTLGEQTPMPRENPLNVSVLPIGLAILLLALVISLVRRR